MIRHLLSLIFCLTIVIQTSDLPAQTGSLNKDPVKLIQKYLDLDMKGARLNSLTFEAQRPYVGWQDEPVWGQIVVVAGYEIANRLDEWRVLNNVDVVIPVRFTILGSVYLEQATFHPDPHIETVGFHVKAITGLWHIVDPMLPPHVGQKRMINFIRQATIEETDPARAAILTTLRDEVTRAKAPDGAARSADSSTPSLPSMTP